jgi:hypothetical protein
MPKTATQTRIRRTDEWLIADLKAKIEQVKRRAALRMAKRDPALRSIGNAERESKDPVTRQALDEARATLNACLSLNRAAPTTDNGVPRARRSGSAVDADALLEHGRKHPGQRGEQIAAAPGLDTVAMRRVMHELIAAKKVKTKAQRRGMSYHLV